MNEPYVTDDLAVDTMSSDEYIVKLRGMSDNELIAQHYIVFGAYSFGRRLLDSQREPDAKLAELLDYTANSGNNILAELRLRGLTPDDPISSVVH